MKKQETVLFLPFKSPDLVIHVGVRFNINDVEKNLSLT